MRIAIITPTYNREKLLNRLYDSLVKQSDREFVWIVIDDGSSDRTEQLISQYCQNKAIEIRYFKKENGGKSAALNFGFENNTDIEFFAVVDSDDWLNDNAIEIIREKVTKYRENDSVGAVFFRYTDVSGRPLCCKRQKCLNSEMCLSRYEHDAKYVKEDGCIGYYSRTVNKYRYPQFPNEKYVGPIVIQMLMADEYVIAFTVAEIGVAEYQEGGLSKSGRKLRLNNPLGMIYYCYLLQSQKNTNTFSRLKYSVEAQAYASVAHLDSNDLVKYNINPKCLKKWAIIPGKLLGAIWRKKSKV